MPALMETRNQSNDPPPQSTSLPHGLTHPLVPMQGQFNEELWLFLLLFPCCPLLCASLSSHLLPVLVPSKRPPPLCRVPSQDPHFPPLPIHPCQPPFLAPSPPSTCPYMRNAVSLSFLFIWIPASYSIHP